MPIFGFLKCVMVGDEGVGKSCLISRYMHRELPREYKPTVFCHHHTTALVDGKPFSLFLVDTTGDPAYRFPRPMDYPGTDVFGLCYSVASPISFENILNKWHPEICEHAPGTPMVLVGLGADIRKDHTALAQLQERGISVVTQREANQLAKTIHAVASVECSATEEVGVDDVFDAALRVACHCYPAESQLGIPPPLGDPEAAPRPYHSRDSARQTRPDLSPQNSCGSGSTLVPSHSSNQPECNRKKGQPQGNTGKPKRNWGKLHLHRDKPEHCSGTKDKCTLM